VNSENTPAWVLRRAIELSDEDGGGDGHSQEPVTMEIVEQVAAELGVKPGAVAKAMAEFRAGVPEVKPKASVADRVFGPSKVSATNRTELDGDAATDLLRVALGKRHGLRSRVTPDGHVVAVRRRGMIPAVVRGVKEVSGRGGLGGVKEVRGVAVTSETGETSLCLVADVSDRRASAVVVGSVVAVGGAAVSGVLVIVVPAAAVGLPVALGAGWVTSRAIHWLTLKRVTEEVEIAAGEIAQGNAPKRLGP